MRDPKKKFSIWSIIKDAIGKDLTKFTVPGIITTFFTTLRLISLLQLTPFYGTKSYISIGVLTTSSQSLKLIKLTPPSSLPICIQHSLVYML